MIPVDAETDSVQVAPGIAETTVEFGEVDGFQCPPSESILRWATAALRDDSNVACIRIVCCEEMRAANKRWRQADYATNVLSFAADLPADFGLPHLGDILICAEVVNAERVQQGKSADAHWAHMVVHGMLHLQGYDHESDEDSEVMEELEINMLAGLGFANPYRLSSPEANG